MTDLQAQSTAYAADRMRNNRGDVFTREDLYYALRDAYEQGWVDCDTKDMKPESAEEFFNNNNSEVDDECTQGGKKSKK